MQAIEVREVMLDNANGSGQGLNDSASPPALGNRCVLWALHC